MRDGMITEEQCGENFAYILEDKTDFLITEYKMMHGQEADFLLKCVKMLYNGKTELYYDTKSCLPLAIQSGAEDTEGMLSVLGNILHEVRRVTENGFLSLLKLDISADKIWVDPATRKIRFVYLPVAERLHKDVVEFEEHLRGELKKTVEKRSDKDYFNQLFSLSQHADILLVSDTLYNSGLKKHDIRHLMILSEHYEPGQTDELDICRLFKYTSVREIFNEITGRCKDTLYAEQDAGKETKIILITSASGGVGKTSVAFGLCRCLERNYKKTLYVNADRLQSFQWMLENGEPIRDASVYAGLSGNLGNVYRIVRHVIRKEGFSYLPPFKAALMSLGIPYRVFALLAEAARKEQEYDYIVIDADSVFDEEKAALMQLADKILIVTKQTEYAVKATNELIQNVNRNNSDKYIFLCNDFKKEEENALLLPTAAHRFTVSEYIEHLPAYEMKGSGLPVQTPGLQKAAFLIM